MCPSNKDDFTSVSLKKAERRKNCDYKERVEKLLGAEFIPAIFSSGGMINPSAKEVINRLAEKIATKTDENIIEIKSEIESDIYISHPIRGQSSQMCEEVCYGTIKSDNIYVIVIFSFNMFG